MTEGIGKGCWYLICCVGEFYYWDIFCTVWLILLPWPCILRITITRSDHTTRCSMVAFRSFQMFLIQNKEDCEEFLNCFLNFSWLFYLNRILSINNGSIISLLTSFFCQDSPIKAKWICAILFGQLYKKYVDDRIVRARFDIEELSSPSCTLCQYLFFNLFLIHEFL